MRSTECHSGSEPYTSRQSLCDSLARKWVVLSLVYPSLSVQVLDQRLDSFLQEPIPLNLSEDTITFTLVRFIDPRTTAPHGITIEPPVPESQVSDLLVGQIDIVLLRAGIAGVYQIQTEDGSVACHWTREL